MKRMVSIFVVVMLSAGTAQGQTTWYVDDDTCPGAGTGTEVDPFCAIQAGIDAAVDVDGDDVLVADGTYTELINFNGKAITVHSINGAAVTTIDGGDAGSVVSCISGENSDTVLDGFTITGGSGTTCFDYETCGGGMYNDNDSNPTVTGCTFSENSADLGGGMYDNVSNPTITACTFSENSAERGGGIYNDGSSPTVTDCTFSGNSTGSSGGGIYNDGSSPTVTDCTFSGNLCSNGSGGGIFNINDSNPTVTGCTFSENSSFLCGGIGNFNVSSPTVIDCTFSGNFANAGGGMCNVESSSSTVTNCTFSGNVAVVNGGGMVNHDSSSTVTNCRFSGNSARDGGGMANGDCNPTVTNCAFSGNTAGGAGSDGAGMHNLNSSPTVTNCTFTENTTSGDGGGMYNEGSSSPTVTNCTLWEDSPDEIFNNDAGSLPTVSFSDVQGGLGAGTIDGGGNIVADPLFIDPDGADDIAGTEDDDLRLDCSSPCTDAGDNDAVPVGVTTDLDGNPRFVDDAGVADTGNPGVAGPPVVDMGAYERQVDSGGVINVPGDFATIQEAIDAACPLAEIIVAPGEYFENINLKGKAITVRSTDPTNPATILATIVNGGGVGTVVTCDSGEGPDTVLSGFLITGGTGSPCFDAESCGGGMHNTNNSSPTVINCAFSGNTADIGAGMYNSGASSPTVTDCTFSGNSAGIVGGGMYNFDRSNPTVTHCVFSGNSAAGGGGMANSGSSPTLTNSVFCRNAPDQISGDPFIDGGGNAISNDHCVPIPNPTPPCNTGDIAPCGGDGVVDLDDILTVIAAFGGDDTCCTR